MRRSRALVVFLALFLVFVLVASVIAIFSMVGGGGTKFDSGSVLVLRVGGPLPEQPMPEQPISALGSTFTSVLEIDSALRKAAVDERIDSVLLRPEPLLAGYAKVQELHGIITRFREDSGKPVTCWMETGSNKEYLLATACDSIYMAPEGFLLVNGLHLGVTFYKGTLDKLGVEAEFTRSGKYKSAIEPLTSTSMSPEFREMMEALADGIFDDFVSTIAESRGMSHEEVRRLIDDPPLTAAGAVRAGLIDGLYYRDQLDAHLAGEEVEPVSAERTPPVDLSPAGADEETSQPPEEAAVDAGDAVELPAPPPEVETADPGTPSDAAPSDEPSEPAPETPEGELTEQAEEEDDSADVPEPNLVSLQEYAQVRPSSLGLGGGPKVAVLYCEGQITSGSSSPSGGMGSQSMGSSTITAALRRIRKDESIKALVIRVDSPGGSGLASDVIWREVELVQERIPVVVSMSDYAASGGYYIAMGADAIVAQPSTLTGSIGVFAGKYNLAGLYDKIGLQTESIDRGEFADVFAADRALGEDGRRKLGEFVDEFYGTFITKAAEGRRSTPAEIHAVAQGRVWTGGQALEVGLVDELGSFRTALDIAKEKAGIDGEVSLALYPRQPTFLEQLLNGGGGAGLLAPLLDGWILDGGAPGAQAVQAARAVLGAAPLFSDGTPVLMPPYHVQVW